ncbi:hypothetical protein HDU91_001085 [Kappamyces sp. JEL0680]|nr:hypothetical protein HDU91_001085 [Kappamyces sp. JEL0680]
MKRPTHSAANFAISTYSNDIFEGFSIRTRDVRPLVPANAKQPSPSRAAITETSPANNRNQSRVAPDSLGEDCRGDHCSVDRAACHPRHKGLFGKSNRTAYLSSHDAALRSTPFASRTSQSTATKARLQALGLTQAGCPSSNSRTMQTSSTYGEERLMKRADKKPLPGTCLSTKPQMSPVSQRYSPVLSTRATAAPSRATFTTF